MEHGIFPDSGKKKKKRWLVGVGAWINNIFIFYSVVLGFTFGLGVDLFLSVLIVYVVSVVGSRSVLTRSLVHYTYTART